MTTITREQALKIIEATDEVISALAGTNEDVHPGSDNMLRLWDDLNDRYAPPEVVRELARIVLASLEAEPVLYQSCTRPTWNSGVPWTEWKERSREGYEDDLRFTDTPDHAGWINKCRKLYTTPPVLEVQADVAQAIENLKQKLVECNRYNYCADAVKGVEDACLAAMLHGAEPVSQTYKLPPLSSNEVNDAAWKLHNMLTEHGPLNGRQFNNLKGCFYEAFKVAMRNYPVTPDGWISCSEQMPDKLIPVMVMYEDGEMWSAMWNGNRWDDGTEYPDPHSVTHWREMPAAPKQEVNRG